MKLGLVLSLSVFWMQACTKGLNTSPGTDTGSSAAQPMVSHQAVTPMDSDPVAINAALAKLPPPSEAKVAALAADPTAALFLAQFSSIFSTSDALSALATDADTNPSVEGLGLADVAPSQPVSEESLSPMEKRMREAARFGNDFFVREGHPAITKESCPDLGLYFSKVIQANLNWKARAQGRLACIDAANSPVFIQDCWGNAASTEATKPYYLWTTLAANLDMLITQLTDKQAKLQTLCTTYFAANPTDTWQWNDFQAALQQAGSATDEAVMTDSNTDVSIATDSKPATQAEPTTSLASVKDAMFLNWTRLQAAKQAANACVRTALPSPQKGKHVPPVGDHAELRTFFSCMGAAQGRRGGDTGGKR